MLLLLLLLLLLRRRGYGHAAMTGMGGVWRESLRRWDGLRSHHEL